MKTKGRKKKEEKMNLFLLLVIDFNLLYFFPLNSFLIQIKC